MATARVELRSCARISGDPKVIHRELGKLYRQHDGAIQPRDVVDAARHPDAPLHPYFEWDDVVAGERFREVQARQLIRSYQLVTTEDGKPLNPPIIANVSVHLPDLGQRYVPTLVAMKDADLRRQIEDDFEKVIQGWIARYRHFPDLRGCVQRVLQRHPEFRSFLQDGP